MPSYNWACLACGVSNLAASERCERCHCPCAATYAQIREAKQAAGVVEPVDGPTRKELATLISRFLFGTPGNRGVLVAGAWDLLQYAVFIFLLLGVFKACGST
jgi:hypothetical protein